MRSRLSTAFVAAAGAWLLAGCTMQSQPKATMDAWVASDMATLTDRTARFDDPLIFDPRTRSVGLFAAANETVSFQLVVEGGSAGLSDVRVQCGALAGPDKAVIDAANIRFFRCHAVKVTEFPPWYLRLVDAVPQPAEVYDALSPADGPGGQPFKVAPNQRLVLWVDVRVPRTAVGGVYKGALKITSSAAEWTMPLATQVYDFVLPDGRPLPAIGGFDHRALFAAMVQRDGKPFVPVNLDRANEHVKRGLGLMRQLMVLAHEHRLDLFDGRMHPTLKRDMTGKVLLDWEDYDAIVGPYLSGSAFEDRIGCAAWPMPFSESWPEARDFGGAGSEAYASAVGGLLAASRQHFTRVLNAPGQGFLWPYRGPVNAAAYDKHMRLAQLARLADGETPILSQLPPQPPPQTTWTPPDNYLRFADILAPRAEWLDPSLAAGSLQPEHPLAGVWLSLGMSPYLPSLGVIATPADARATAWFAMKYRCSGLFLPEVLNWTSDMFATAGGAETRLFYPGASVGVDGVLPSIRLKRLRRGLQDLAYLSLMQQRQRGATAETLLTAMTRYGGLAAAGDNYLDPRLNGWVQDPMAWEMARRLMAEEILAAVHPAQATGAQLLAQRVLWRQFEEQTAAVRVEQIRSRVVPVVKAVADGGKSQSLQAVVTLDLYNEYSRDVDCLVRLEQLPDGWKAIVGEQRITFPAASRRVVTLTAEGTYVPAGSGGKLPLPVSVSVDMRQQARIVARVPFLQAGKAVKPPVVDGLLDDWPPRVGNAAGEFKLIGRRGENGAGLAQRQTLAFVMHDEQNLYLGFRCDEPNMAGLTAKPSNIIQYQQLMACGEDLVEVILDPGAAAKGPEELYHIIVKPNGVLLTERGVHTDPPLGKSEPWPVAASVAVQRQDNLWTVELAIPLSAFGPAGKERLWGVNFTRFAPQGSEASSWAGAPRYFYDPRNLGTMLIVTGE